MLQTIGPDGLVETGLTAVCFRISQIGRHPLHEQWAHPWLKPLTVAGFIVATNCFGFPIVAKLVMVQRSAPQMEKFLRFFRPKQGRGSSVPRLKLGQAHPLMP